MNPLQASLVAVLRRPDQACLVALQEALLAELAAGPPERHRQVGQALETLDHFHQFLAQVQAKTTAREFSEIASWLDIGALGMVALNRLVLEEGGDLKDLIAGALAEGLMVAASRQYVKAWDQEAELSNRQAVWYLRGALWQVSLDQQPDMDSSARLRAIRQLLAPTADETLSPAGKLVLIGCLFQVVLQFRVGRLLTGGRRAGGSAPS